MSALDLIKFVSNMKRIFTRTSDLNLFDEKFIFRNAFLYFKAYFQHFIEKSYANQVCKKNICIEERVK